MIKSKFIADVVGLLLDSQNNSIDIRLQKEFITDTVCGYMSKGLFVTFSHTEDIIAHKSANENLIINGVKITSTAFNFEAEATLFFRKGIVDCLEISATKGKYPQQELTEYTLNQI
ncbi:hypothetical protein [Mucilaginibacter sp. dw_454]|uniref:hypothetical protein n=1 Tax=Mucilaginibacter sp. dw_454 TaxID=2720079 RepID=UPI001BD4ED5C|nr:hypothetical protein [Mucilaginibacter sp. dw_454]